MGQVKGLTSAEATYHECISNIIKLAEHGLVHGDFNEFNLMISEQEDVTVIDFPQMVSTTHLNAQFYFERDVKCIQTFFSRRFGLMFEGVPILETDIQKTVDLDHEVKASGHLNQEDLEYADSVTQALLDQVDNDGEDDSSEEEEGEAEEEGKVEEPEDAAMAEEGEGEKPKKKKVQFTMPESSDEEEESESDEDEKAE